MCSHTLALEERGIFMAVAAETLAHQPVYEEANRYLYEYDNVSTWLPEVADSLQLLADMA
jgi:hypothetical protein